MRIHLDYYDQNEAFGRALPAAGVDGTATRSVTLRGWIGDWRVVVLDQSFEYKGRRYVEVLVRSRWKDHEIGGDQPTSVFIFLPRRPLGTELTAAAPDDFEFVAWGIAKTVGHADDFGRR